MAPRGSIAGIDQPEDGAVIAVGTDAEGAVGNLAVVIVQGVVGSIHIRLHRHIEIGTGSESLVVEGGLQVEDEGVGAAGLPEQEGRVIGGLSHVAAIGHLGVQQALGLVLHQHADVGVLDDIVLTVGLNGEREAILRLVADGLAEVLQALACHHMELGQSVVEDLSVGGLYREVGVAAFNLQRQPALSVGMEGHGVVELTGVDDNLVAVETHEVVVHDTHGMEVAALADGLIDLRIVGILEQLYEIGMGVLELATPFRYALADGVGALSGDVVFAVGHQVDIVVAVRVDILQRTVPCPTDIRAGDLIGMGTDGLLYLCPLLLAVVAAIKLINLERLVLEEHDGDVAARPLGQVVVEELQRRVEDVIINHRLRTVEDIDEVAAFHLRLCQQGCGREYNGQC